MVRSAAPVHPPRRRGIRITGIAVLGTALLAIGTGWWFFFGTPALPPDWRATAVVLAGDGVPGWRDGVASRARFSDPFGVAASADGTVFVADAGQSQRVRRIAPDGAVSTVAGGGLGFADGAGAAARFDTPSGLALAADGTLYVADTGNNAIRRITPDGLVSTLAGDGIAGYRDGPGHQARFNGPIGVAVDAAGRVIVADTYNDRIRAIDPQGTVSTLAGSGEPGLLDGLAAHARFDTPCGVALDASGRIHVADTGNGLVRAIGPGGLVTTVAGPPGDALVRPIGMAATPDGEVYVTDDRGRIVELSAGGSARTLAGSTGGFRDGPGRDARFRQPTGIAVTGPGRLIVADAGNALVRLLGAPSRLELRPPASPRINPRFDDESFARLPLLWPVAPMEGPHEVAGTMGEARGDGAERFHSGIDVRVEEGTPVRVVRDGMVAAPASTGAFGSLNEWLRIGAVTYVHIRAGRTGHHEMLDTTRFVPTYDESGGLVRVRTKRGSRFTTGEIIGTVNPFNHVHLNVGWPGDEHNPLHFRLVHFEDAVPPTIARRGVRVYDEYDQPLTTRARGRVLVSGRVRIVVDAWDQADGNRPSRRLGLYALGYQVLGRDGSAAPGFETGRDTIRFDRLQSESDAAQLIYAAGSGIPFYGGRPTRFLYVITNTLTGGMVSEGFWDTALLPPGDYVLRIRASDIRGNMAVTNRDLPVTIVSHAATVSGGQ